MKAMHFSLYYIVMISYFISFCGVVNAYEFSGYIAAESTLFPNSSIHNGQREQAASLSFQPEFYHELQDGSSLNSILFLRLDSSDSNRSHIDIRELNYLHLADSWEMQFGLSKVFWGVTEFVHLVDIINQSDSVESIDGEEKLGQPMVKLSLQRDWGTVDFFVLPWFRERTYQGTKGRLRNALIVDVDNPRYEKGGNQRHIDLASRYSATLGDWDLGLHYFRGIDREPQLQIGVNNQGNPVLFPFYHLIDQIGADLQLVAGECLWKLESIYRAGEYDDYFSATGGFEYTYTSIGESNVDLGIIAEFAFDQRRNTASTPMANDALFGLRLNINDAASSELLAGLSYDVDNGTTGISFEASTRILNYYKLIVKGYSLNGQPSDDLLYSLRDDDYLQLTLAYYF